MRVLRLRRPCVCLSLTPGPVSNAVNVGLLTASPPPHSLENNKQPSAPSPCRICTARSQSVGQDLSACRRKFNPRGFVPSRASPNSPRDFISQFPPLSSSSSSSSSSSQNEAQKQKSMFLLPCPILLSRCHCKHSRNSSDITISALFSRPPLSLLTLSLSKNVTRVASYALLLHLLRRRRRRRHTLPRSISFSDSKAAVVGNFVHTIYRLDAPVYLWLLVQSYCLQSMTGDGRSDFHKAPNRNKFTLPTLDQTLFTSLCVLLLVKMANAAGAPIDVVRNRWGQIDCRG